MGHTVRILHDNGAPITTIIGKYSDLIKFMYGDAKGKHIECKGIDSAQEWFYKAVADHNKGVLSDLRIPAQKEVSQLIYLANKLDKDTVGYSEDHKLSVISEMLSVLQGMLQDIKKGK